jgi:ankyrin repeat protein
LDFDELNGLLRPYAHELAHHGWEIVIPLPQNAGFDTIDKLLRWASRKGLVDFVQLFLAHGADVHSFSDEALRMASWNGREVVVQLLLAHGADVHANDDEPIRSTPYYGYSKVVELLLKHGANIHAKNDAALRGASEKGHVGNVKILLAHGAQPDKLMVLLAEESHFEIAKLLRARLSATNAKSPVSHRVEQNNNKYSFKPIFL